MIKERTFNNEKNTWVNLDTRSLSQTFELDQKYGIDNEIISYAIDKNERARVEYVSETGICTIIYNVTKQTNDTHHYETVPMTFLIKDNHLISISNDDNYYIVEKMEHYLDDHLMDSLFEFLFASLLMMTDDYFPKIEEMERNRTLISNMLREKTTKKNLLALSDLETGGVYFISATNQNTAVLQQLKNHPLFQHLTASEIEKLDDVLIEARQAAEMTQMDAQILQQLSGTYNNILNNNLNDNMKVLTTLSILLTVPTIVTGFFGMNMPLPLEHDIYGWLITIGISALGWFGLAFILRQIMK
jgi:Mg2+ and Co2+ transporters